MLGKANGTSGGELAMGAEEEIGLVAHGFADEFAELGTEFHRLQRGLARIESGIWCGGIKLNSGEAELGIVRGAFGGGFGVPIDGIGLALGEIGIDIGVGAELFVHASAEKFIDGLADGFSDDIPQGDFNAGEHTHQAHVRAERIARAVDLAPQAFDVKRVHAFNVAPESILDHGSHGLGAEGGTVALANAGDAIVGCQFHEGEIAATPARWRIADNKDFQIGDFHGGVSFRTMA